MKTPVTTKVAAGNLVTTRDDISHLLRQPAGFIDQVVCNPSQFYTSFSVPKPNGELRTIRPPTKLLRKLQRVLLERLYERVEIPFYLHGGIPRRSILTHARAHVGRAMVATLDVRKFFPSTSANHVRPVLECLGFRDGAVQDVLGLTLLDNQLPQGAPTSCLLAHLAFAAGDRAFIEICRVRRLHFSRYIDDVAISGASHFDDLKGPFIECIEKNGYFVADDKVHFRSSARQQVVTGLVVNQQLRPTNAFIAELKELIRLCQQHGARFVADLDGTSVTSLKARLTGKVAHLARSHSALGKRFRGKLCGVDWSMEPRAPAEAGA